MAPSLQIPVSVGGLLVAIAFVIGGGPLFAFGLRALRVRRALSRLREEALSLDSRGLVYVQGKVAIESPMFSPLSQQPCAGFTLHVNAEGTRIGGVVRQQRAFRLESAQASARVEAVHQPWATVTTAERRIAPGEALSERLAGLFESNAELRWLRRSGQTLVLREQALLPNAHVHVLAHAHVAESDAVVGEIEYARTGTDDAPVSHAGAATKTTELVLGGDDPHMPCVVSSLVPSLSAIRPSRLETAGAIAGPLLTMAGLLYLAQAAEALLGVTS